MWRKTCICGFRVPRKMLLLFLFRCCCKKKLFRFGGDDHSSARKKREEKKRREFQNNLSCVSVVYHLGILYAYHTHAQKLSENLHSSIPLCYCLQQHLNIYFTTHTHTRTHTHRLRYTVHKSWIFVEKSISERENQTAKM